MLNIYTSMDSLPKDRKFIFDVDPVINAVKITGNEFQRMVIERIEKGSYHNNAMFKDRFGGLLYYNSMSIGSKALFVVEYYSDWVINCTECGENALRLLSYLKEGNIFISNRMNPLPWDVDYPVTFNGRVWERVSLLNDYLR